MRSTTNYLVLTLVLTSAFFIFPPVQHASAFSTESLVLLLLASTGILLSRIFVLSMDGNDTVGIESAVIVCLATWNNLFMIYPITVILAFSGSLINSIRTEKNLSFEIPRAVFRGVSFAFLLRFSSFVYWDLFKFSMNYGAVQAYLVMVATVIPVVLLRCFSVCYFGSGKISFLNTLKKNLLMNGFILLLAVPSALAVLRCDNSATIMLSCTFGVFSMLVVHGISLRQNRSAHEKTNELETVLTLKELSSNLFHATSEMDAVRTLSEAVSKAWDSRVAVRWKSLTYFQGEKWITTNSVSVEHKAGLTIWIDSFSSTIPLYMESFLNRAVPVLSGLDAEKKMKKASWEAIETMVSFVEQNNSDFAGFSRRVAATATILCKALKVDQWYEDCMHLAGLLHMVSLNDKSEDNYFELPLALPEITRQALAGIEEHWSGTGPSGTTGEDIPLPARILAVSIAWEKAMNSGSEMAIRDMNMRAGTIHDPRLAELIIQLNS